MDENIPLSTEINNINNTPEDDEISTYIDEIDFEDILQSTNISENIFVKQIAPKINDQLSIPPVNHIGSIYLSNLYNSLIPKKCNYKLITGLIRIIQIIGILIVVFGFALPSKLLKYHIILCIKILILWEYLDNKCYLSMAIQKLSNLNQCPEFLLFDSDFSKQLVLILMFTSIIGMVIPDLSFFKIFYKIFNTLKKYD